MLGGGDAGGGGGFNSSVGPLCLKVHRIGDVLEGGALVVCTNDSDGLEGALLETITLRRHSSNGAHKTKSICILQEQSPLEAVIAGWSARYFTHET